MPKQIAAYFHPEGYWSRKETAEYLNLSVSHIRHLTQIGQLNGHKIEKTGGQVWYLPAEVKDFKKRLAKIKKV